MFFTEPGLMGNDFPRTMFPVPQWRHINIRQM
jgi:hypothetical protein